MSTTERQRGRPPKSETVRKLSVSLPPELVERLPRPLSTALARRLERYFLAVAEAEATALPLLTPDERELLIGALWAEPEIPDGPHASLRHAKAALEDSLSTWGDQARAREVYQMLSAAVLAALLEEAERRWRE